MKLILIAIISMLSVPGLALAVELPPLERGEIEYPNMDSRLTHIYISADEYAIPASTNNMEDRIRVVLVMEYPDAPIPEDLGIEIEASYEELVQVMIPVGNLAKIADDGNVRLVRMPSMPVPSSHTTGMTVSEGANTISSIQANHAGYTGKGVNVAVIDSGFDISNTEIAPNISGYKSFDYDHGIRGDNIKHGTASTEIVVDVAPDVNLYLYNFSGEIGFLNLLDHIIDRRDIDIITMSQGWYNSVGQADGTSSISQKVNEARDNGILFVTSAGNEAERHWQGKFQDTDYDDWHNFDGQDETIRIDVDADKELKVVLSWWDSPSLDFDLYLLDEDLDSLESSLNSQPSFSPYEVIEYMPYYDRKVYVAIKNYNGLGTADIQLFSNYDFDKYAVAESSITIPADAKGSLSVGAVDWQYGTLEKYSSHGPTLDGRIKPDLIAPTCVDTTSYENEYCGTSASAPHVAGTAALVMQKYPDMTPDQIRGLLEENTQNHHPKQNADGTGLLDVSWLPAAVADSPVDCSIRFISWQPFAYAGTEMRFDGQLTCGSEGIAGKAIILLEDDPLLPDEVLAGTTTGENGHFFITWVAEAQLLERELDIYASFSGDDDHDYARSANLEVHVSRYGGSLTLDEFPAELVEGTVLSFTGSLQIDNHSSEGAAVYIKDEDTTNADDLLATAYVNADGSFSADWVVRHQDTDDPVIEIYAVFEGDDTLGRLTTCDDGYTSPLGGLCLDTVDVTILDGDLPPGLPGYGEYVHLYYSHDFDKAPHVAIVPSPDSYDVVGQYIIPTQEGVLMWTSEMSQLYAGDWSVTFEVVEPGMRFAQKPDIIMSLETYSDNPSCGVDYSGVAYLNGMRPVQTIVCAESSSISATAAHEFIHAMGLGHVFNKPRDMMCSVEGGISTCPGYWSQKETTPSRLSLGGVATLYGTDGYQTPNSSIERGERYSLDRGLYSYAPPDIMALEERLAALEAKVTALETRTTILEIMMGTLQDTADRINTSVTGILARLTVLEINAPIPTPTSNP